MQITEKIPINSLIEKNPEVIPILMSYGLHCIGCSFSALDTLEDGAKLHGFDDKEIQMMLKDVNKILEENKE